MDERKSRMIGIALFTALAMVGVAIAGWDARRSTPHARMLRAIRAAPIASIAGASDGQYVRLVGALRLGEQKLVAPLSQRTCACYLAVVEELRSGENGSYWYELAKESVSCDFVVEDATGRAHVRGVSQTEPAIVLDHLTGSSGPHDPKKRELALLKRHALSPTHFVRGRVRYGEGALEPDERVTVVGRARWEDDPTPGAIDPTGYRDTSRRRRLVIEPMPDGRLFISNEPMALTR